MSDIIRGRTQVERNASIEHALKSLSRRAVKRAAVHIPPIPFFTYCSAIGEDKVIGRMMVPFSGTMKDLYVRIGVMATKEAKVALFIDSDVAETTMHFELSKRVQKLEVEMPISAGTALTMMLEEGDLKEILIGTAIYVDVTTTKAKEVMLEEILKQVDEEENALQN